MRAVRALTLGISLALGGGMAAATFLPTLAMAADAAQSIGPKVGKPMKAAQDAMKAKNWAEALAKVKEAQAIEGKTPFEEYQINEFLGFILINQKDFAGAANAFEKNVNSGQVPAAELNNKLKTLAQLTFQTKQYPKAIDYTARYLKAVPGETDMQMLLAQAYYLQKNFKGAAEAAVPAIVATERAGKKPDENWLLLLMRSNYELNDNAGISTALEKLVRHYPKPDYWDGLLSTMAKTGERNDRLTLGIYRLRLETGTLKRADDYVEMGQLAIDAGVPGEAQQVVEAGFANKLLDVPESKARNERLLASAKKLVDADKATIATEDKAARAAPTGQADVGIGQAYLSYGQYDQAIEALERGIKKGGVKLPEEAQISLGIAYLKKGQKAQAQTAFKAVTGDTPWARLASLWALRAS
jgi:tetratricopeptide (TPR) repeat protein